MVSPIERASQQLATAQAEVRYFHYLLRKKDTYVIIETIGAWREMVIISGGRGGTKTTLTNLQALGIIDDPYESPINTERLSELMGNK
mgnify:FL=1